MAEERRGRVYLVGAGPGDPKLLTVRALELIRQADLIIYDTLANPAHLAHARPQAKTICVGKGFRYKTLDQAKINRLILRAAREGRTVVRLKGGDPYLFGRGGEEALMLFENKISFEVVPGVTSATACAAYAGIPLTHREHSASVTFLTGHRAGDDNLDSIPWERITALGGTLVIYMGFYNLRRIAERLAESGMPGDTPVCVVEWGTLPWQKSCEGPLADIAGLVGRRKLRAPCIIMIGEVVRLRGKLNWFERLPLFGKKIIVTRTADKAGAFCDKLSALGAWVFSLPVIEVRPVQDFKAMDEAIRRLETFQWLIFTSGYGVDAFFRRLERRHGKDARALKGIRVAVVGPETGCVLRRRGIAPDLEPARFETRVIAAEFRKRFRRLDRVKIALFRTDIATPELEDALKKLGASVTRITAYRTARPRTLPEDVRALLTKGGADFVTFTSSSTVTNLVRIAGLKNLKRIASRTAFASIGPVTSKTLRRWGLPVGCQAKVFTTDGLVGAIRKRAGGRTWVSRKSA